jgi:hypothetical protein
MLIDFSVYGAFPGSPGGWENTMTEIVAEPFGNFVVSNDNEYLPFLGAVSTVTGTRVWAT